MSVKDNDLDMVKLICFKHLVNRAESDRRNDVQVQCFYLSLLAGSFFKGVAALHVFVSANSRNALYRREFIFNVQLLLWRAVNKLKNLTKTIWILRPFQHHFVIHYNSFLFAP